MLREFAPFLLNKFLLLRKQFSETLEYSACPLSAITEVNQNRMTKFYILIIVCTITNFLTAQEPTLTPIVFGPSVVSEGDLFEVQITVANSNREEITSVLTEGEQNIEFKDGIAIVRFKADRSLMALKGVITIKSNGEVITKKWDHDVFVMKHIAQIGNDLPYLYRGIENKIDTRAMGFPSTIVNGSGVAISKKQGDYYAYPDAKTDTVTISVSGMTVTGDEVFIRDQKFLVLNIPSPQLSLNGTLSGNEVSIENLRLEAKLDSSAPVSAAFSIVSWEIFANSKSQKGNDKDLSIAKKTIKSLKSGDHFSIVCEIMKYDKLEKLSGVWFIK